MQWNVYKSLIKNHSLTNLSRNMISINMEAFLYKTIFVVLLCTLVKSNYSGPWDNQEDCDHPENMKEKECFCYTTPENDFEYSNCKEPSNLGCENKHVNDIKKYTGR